MFGYGELVFLLRLNKEFKIQSKRLRLRLLILTLDKRFKDETAKEFLDCKVQVYLKRRVRVVQVEGKSIKD